MAACGQDSGGSPVASQIGASSQRSQLAAIHTSSDRSCGHAAGLTAGGGIGVEPLTPSMEIIEFTFAPDSSFGMPVK